MGPRYRPDSEQSVGCTATVGRAGLLGSVMTSLSCEIYLSCLNFTFNISTNPQTVMKEKIKIITVLFSIKGRFLTRYTEIKVILFHSVAV